MKAGKPARRWRPGVWLTTLSTLLAVATGIVTLRGQIFPSHSGQAQAALSGYQQSVGEVCDALNQADGARAANVNVLSVDLQNTRSPVAQRNAVLDSWNQVLANSEHGLGMLEGLVPPRALAARQRETVDAWSRSDTMMRDFVQQLDTVANEAGLLAAIETIPGLQSTLGAEFVTRSAGLTNLGGSHCLLNPTIPTPTITLPMARQFSGLTRTLHAPGSGVSSEFTPTVGAELPFTGLDDRWLATVGVALLGAGTALRRLG